jgi:hypothetical protein
VDEKRAEGENGGDEQHLKDNPADRGITPRRGTRRAPDDVRRHLPFVTLLPYADQRIGIAYIKPP